MINPPEGNPRNPADQNQNSKDYVRNRLVETLNQLGNNIDQDYFNDFKKEIQNNSVERSPENADNRAIITSINISEVKNPKDIFDTYVAIREATKTPRTISIKNIALRGSNNSPDIGTQSGSDFINIGISIQGDKIIFHASPNMEALRRINSTIKPDIRATDIVEFINLDPAVFLRN